ncbi:MAG TPA: thioredoxin domain-containing protein [Solirubrobacterales bacterium]|nr:thioredoxin domain-containing protein [Solirubrobacterales bacterium]
MSNKREREKRREERLQAEAQVGTTDRRKRLLQMAAGAVFLAIAAVAVLIIVNAGGDSGGDTEIEKTAEVNQLLQGIPQQDLVLGDPNAPVELIEYGDLQCPVCKSVAETTLPQIIQTSVRRGEVKIDFRNFIVISEESIPAAAAAIAAGEQGKGWTYLDLFYENQGIERSGYVTDEFLEAVAKGAGIKDLAKWNKDREAAQRETEIEKDTQEAQTLGFEGTPSFAIKGPSTNGLELLGSAGTAAQLEEAIKAAS